MGGYNVTLITLTGTYFWQKCWPRQLLSASHNSAMRATDNRSHHVLLHPGGIFYWKIKHRKWTRNAIKEKCRSMLSWRKRTDPLHSKEWLSVAARGAPDLGYCVAVSSRYGPQMVTRLVFIVSARGPTPLNHTISFVPWRVVHFANWHLLRFPQESH